MKKSQITKGRVEQKRKTRSAILEAAKELMHKEEKISLEDVAQKANISRATMYRYYSNIDLLFTEATLEIHHKTSEEILQEVQDMPMEDRIYAIQKHYIEQAQQNEIIFRRYLSAALSESITSNEPLRGARRMKSLHLALSPFKDNFDKDTYRKLIWISSVLMGIDPLITCKDVCNLSNEESATTLKWALEMILKGIAQEVRET